MLLDAGADVNVRLTGSFPTALEAAAFGGCLEIAQLLLEAGADISGSVEPCGDVICCTAEGGQVEVLRLLMENGVDVDASSSSWGTMLAAASARNHVEFVGFLIQLKGNDISREDLNDAFQAACGGHRKPHPGDSFAPKNGCPEVVKLLLAKGADVSANSSNALLNAAKNGHLDVVRLLLENGADVNAIPGGDVRRHCLLAALSSRNRELVYILVQAGVDFDVHEDLGRHVLRDAAQHGYEDIVKSLIERGCLNDDNDAHVYQLRQALEAAVDGGHANIAQTLIACGADVNQKTYRGNPLSRACGRGDEIMFKLLLDAGADLEALAPSPLQGAAMSGNIQILTHVLERDPGTDIEEALSVIRDFTQGEMATTMLDWARDQGIDISLDDALARACYKDQALVVRILLGKGANANARTAAGDRSLFHDALLRGRPIVAEQFLTANLDLDSQEEELLCLAAQQSSPKIVKALISRGKPFATDTCLRALGDTPMEQDRQIARPIFQRLLANGLKVDERIIHRVCIGEGMLKSLLCSKADLAVIVRHLHTALRFLLSADNIPLAELLIAKTIRQIKASLMVKSKVLQVACIYGLDQIVRLLLELNPGYLPAHQDHINTALEVAAATGHSHIVGLLLDHMTNLYGNIPELKSDVLKAAAANGNPLTIQLLLNAGAQVAYGRAQASALYVAAEGGHKLAVGLLLHAGVKLRVNKNCDEASRFSENILNALEVAIRNGYVRIANELLRNSKCDVGAVLRKGFQEAVTRGHKRIVLLLLKHPEVVDEQRIRLSSALQVAVAKEHA